MLIWTGDPVPERAPHRQDEDCTVDPGNGLCRWCNVWHGDPCDGCGGRGFHRTWCNEAPLMGGRETEAPDGSTGAR